MHFRHSGPITKLERTQKHFMPDDNYVPNANIGAVSGSSSEHTVPL
jgi:hypothetical protein